jgi:hypothetical protein
LSLYYLRARYYNPFTGRFLSVDSQASEGQRRYEYAGADPVNGMDPTGNNDIIEFELLNFQPSPIMSWPKFCWVSGSTAIGAFLPVCGDGSGGGGGGGGGGGQSGPGGPPYTRNTPLPPPPDIRLWPVTDTTIDTGFADRDIDYKIKNTDGTRYTGTPLWVNELIMPLHGSPAPKGTVPVGGGYYSSASPKGRPNDWFDGLGVGLGNVNLDYTQSFIASTAPGLYPAASESILVRYGGNDHPTISLHLGSNHVVLTNGLTVYPGTVQ